MPSNFRLSVVLLLVSAAACAVDLGLGRDEVPTRTYWLQPVDVAADAPVGEVTVAAVPGLDTDRMLALDADQQLVPFAGARWNGSIPQVVRSLAERSLDGTRGEAALHLEVRRFFVEQSGTGNDAATIELSARHAARDQPALFVVREPLGEARLGAVAAAFQRAMDDLMHDLAAWLADPSDR